MKRRIAELPLHTGRAPAWLFKRMWRLAGAITMAVVDEYGPAEMLRRLSDPWWFQAFGCVLGFDWHSSGVTTVTCGALKEAYKHFGDDLGICVAGGKGGVSRNTPAEIAAHADRLAISGGDKLIFASKMSAKVDSAAVQDGFGVYHHSFFFTPAGEWCVVQQGMNESARSARRYHWLGASVDDFVCEPHAAIQDLVPRRRRRDDNQLLLNMVAAEAEANRRASVELVGWNLEKLMFEARRLTEGPTLFAPAHHDVRPADMNLDRLERVIADVQAQEPGEFATLLGQRGVGPATIRSLSLLAEIIYDAPASRRDPATPPPSSPAGERRWADYSYAHGGKDGFPFPVDRTTYDQNIAVLTDAVRKAKAGDNEKTEALKRLARFNGGTRD